MAAVASSRPIGGQYGNYNAYDALKRAYEYLPNGWLKWIIDDRVITTPEFSYEYDGDGNIVAADEAGRHSEYAYDAKRQLVLWRDSAGIEHEYAYDPAGNITNKDGVTYTYDAANQITNAGFVYDANGNLLSDGAKTYEYDGENRLARVSYTRMIPGYVPGRQYLPEDPPPDVAETVVADYTYNYQGLRVKKVVSRVSSVGSSVEETYFVYDLSGNLIEERSGPDPSAWIRRYAWGPGGRPAIVEVSAAYDPVNYGHFVARTNLRGDVVSLVKCDTGAPESASYQYDPWGKVLGQTGLEQPIKYASYYYDEESGLYYLKARYYSPELGRFLTKDPVMSTPACCYGAGNPTTCVDRSGCVEGDVKECSEDECLAVIIDLEGPLGSEGCILVEYSG